MPDEATAPAETQDTPVSEAAPESGTSTEGAPEQQDGTSGAEVDYFDEKFDPDSLPEELRPAHKLMHGRFTQRMQELAERERSEQSLVAALQNPDTAEDAFRSLAQQLGYELEDDDELDGPEGDEDTEFRDPRVDQILEEQEQRAQQEALQELSGHVDSLAKEHDLELTDRQREAIMAEAIRKGFSPDATEEVVKGWAQDFGSYRDKVIALYRESKQAPAPPQRGSSGTPDVPLTDQKSRLARAQQVAAEVMDGS